ncbi:hypothetical protein C1H46_032593 [Malus baccata]|uniref:Uncharacterized protein n=1 Tax=Malus baccata TaxID=106549 RepID=A0A540L5V5_MALBA|nr:hypothetical protein C1H46_032593 [Malus baccata]
MERKVLHRPEMERKVLPVCWAAGLLGMQSAATRYGNERMRIEVKANYSVLFILEGCLKL